MTAPPSPRISPLAPPYEPEVAELLRRWMPPGSDIEPLALFRTLAVHPELCARMRPLGVGILGHGRLAARDREIIIDRTCARSGAEYEWGVHAQVYGLAVGLTDAQIEATAAGRADDPAWSASDARLIRVADALHDTGGVPDDLWGELARDYEEDQLLEIVIVAGWYRLISSVLSTIRVALEPWAARFPATGAPAGRD